MANPIDLRSDTVTRPSQAMRQAMASAEVGDDVYSDDPTVNSLEERVAALFGKEAGVFTPTGSLANQLAIRMLVAPGEELIAETNSHIVRAELGAAAVFSGITTRTWPAKNGLLVAKDALEIARPNSGPYLVSTTAIAVENTHNFGGGTVQPLEEIKALRKGADEIGVALHLDGARIWNAHVASGVAFNEYGKYFDTISVCLSKGLGAPIGSVMLSTKERVGKARVWRKRYGAGMRQVGLLAGAAHYALDNNIARLSEDHRRAKELAVAIAAIDKSFVDPALVETNIVGLDLANAPYTAAELATRCREAGLWISALGPKYARLVTHLDFDDEQCAAAIEILKRVLVA
ncbi:MAG: beta-eliminating lyase-related protein [Actinobacteria bacterium]|nr:beta-eliminating lyase-related protein [Actinomycetota bacterium]